MSIKNNAYNGIKVKYEAFLLRVFMISIRYRLVRPLMLLLLHIYILWNAIIAFYLLNRQNVILLNEFYTATTASTVNLSGPNFRDSRWQISLRL